ncbi:hypothetical protein EBS80_05480 [bacterium]|nr:hypothetical protein [bacterium]
MVNLHTFLTTPVSILAPPAAETNCPVCRQPVVGESEYRIAGENVHEDCYFNRLGALVERGSTDVTTVA